MYLNHYTKKKKKKGRMLTWSSNDKKIIQLKHMKAEMYFGVVICTVEVLQEHSGDAVYSV